MTAPEPRPSSRYWSVGHERRSGVGDRRGRCRRPHPWSRAGTSIQSVSWAERAVLVHDQDLLGRAQRRQVRHLLAVAGVGVAVEARVVDGGADRGRAATPATMLSRPELASSGRRGS